MKNPLPAFALKLIVVVAVVILGFVAFAQGKGKQTPNPPFCEKDKEFRARIKPWRQVNDPDALKALKIVLNKLGTGDALVVIADRSGEHMGPPFESVSGTRAATSRTDPGEKTPKHVTMSVATNNRKLFKAVVGSFATPKRQRR